MALADWLASGADPGKMTPEEIRRRQQICAVREEQSGARLEALLRERDDVFVRGAETRSAPLRRVLARRWARIDSDVRALERELARIGKEAAGLLVLRNLRRDGVTLRAPGDCTPLLTALDDFSACEDEFAARLSAGLTGARGDAPRTGPVAAESAGVLLAWTRLDKGETPSVAEALRRLDES